MSGTRSNTSWQTRWLSTPVLLMLAAPGVGAQGITRDEALASMYPGAATRAEQVFLTAAQQKRARDIAGTEVPSALVTRYLATKDGQVIGRAYLDTHTVRTKKETLLVMLDALGRIKRVEVTAFLEPAEFKAPEPWLRQYNDRVLAPELALNRAIRPIAGATLTARATNNAVRRILAIDQTLRETDPRGQR